MPSTSETYKKLVSCEKKIRNKFLTRNILTNFQSQNAQYNIYAYRILCHGEIEYYIEEAIRKRINIVKNNWINHKKYSKCIASLIAYTENKFNYPLKYLNDVNNNNNLNYRINKVFSSFDTELKKNHGIKEENIVPLLVAIGITDIDQALLNTLSSFGSARGTIAHSSTSVNNLINPQDEILTVNNIITSLKDLDQKILNVT